MSKETGGCAFPFVPEDGTEWNQIEFGMTLRDYFPAKAMAAIVNGAIAVGQGFNSHDESEKLAGAAYRIADAMIDFRGQ
ncbi:hypothetical protein M1E08_09555 [Erwinia sp. PK3-005]